MNHGKFQPVADAIEHKYPGDYEMWQEVNRHGVTLFNIRRQGVKGRVILFEPDPSFLTSVEFDEPSDEGETIRAKDPAEVLEVVEDWSIERPWTLPPPIDRKKEMRRLSRIADGLRLRSCEVTVRADDRSEISESSLTAFQSHIGAIGRDQILSNFPPDTRGRIATNTSCLLARYLSPKSSPNRELCLVAAGPERRKDPEVIEVRLEWIIPANQNYNWESETWRWKLSENGADDLVRWGVPNVPMDLLKAGPASIPTLQKRLDVTSASDGDRAALSILLQDEGRFSEALDLYGAKMIADLHRLSGRQKIYPEACCAHAGEKWTLLLHQKLRELAIWKLKPIIEGETARLRTWAAEKKSRKMRPPMLKLAIFPGQPHSRMATLALTSDPKNKNRPLLTMETTASNARLHLNAYQRPLDLEFQRFGISPKIPN